MIRKIPKFKPISGGTIGRSMAMHSAVRAHQDRAYMAVMGAFAGHYKPLRGGKKAHG